MSALPCSSIEQPDLSEVLGAPDDGENEMMEDEVFYDAPEQQDNVDVALGEATSTLSSTHHHHYQVPEATRKPIPSLEHPETAFSFELLNFFQILNHQGKVSAYDFYLAVYNIRDNAGLANLPERYEQLLAPDAVMTQVVWHQRYKASAQWSVQPALIQAKNLPDGWEFASETKCWLYSLIAMADASYKMKSKEKGIENDPPLGDGWGHFVLMEPYNDYFKQYGNQIELNLCDSELCATDVSSKTAATGFKFSGIGGALCGRHTLVFKNGLGNLTKGERFANMDFIIFSAILSTALLMITFSYDICSYMHLKKKILRAAKIVLPKLHLYNHGKKCQLNLNLNFLWWSAQSDLEDPERLWAHLNPLSIKFLAQLNRAVEMHAKHCKAFNDFNNTFPPAAVEKWNQMVIDWDKDTTKPNPYEEPSESASLVDVHLELAREEEEEVKWGRVPMHEMSPVCFLQTGFALEEEQRKLCVLFAQTRTTILCKAELLEKWNALRCCIIKWREVQMVYMPGAEQIIARAKSITSTEQLDHAELENLFLPSSISPANSMLCCIPGLADKECSLCFAQADDALNELRRQLHVTLSILVFKRGQHSANPSMCSALQHCLCSSSALDPRGNWTQRLQKLDHSKDLQLPRREEEDPKKKKAMCVEWAKMKARADCWEEEILLTIEEMRHVIHFLDWHAKWWQERADLRPDVDPALRNGLRAYAAKQADMQQGLAQSFAKTWYPSLVANHFPIEWPSKYIPAS
ncbi:hypothetical protein PILCRDRAFT_9123 [Piloderma croceum F 1598]|uniref:CxC2-like cysteine cluster KDZ transposase-associated domain-containing protein n=1 Tax=Piloderma croceum (strain F 1598) TaxID=765440 RepID=A0A0C3BUV9_PILCF|nr:hypothetical protein PILCRDRAFT_9123 [Piloderma croceum F 1598]